MLRTLILGLCLSAFTLVAEEVILVVETNRLGAIDLTRYALGQGGLSDKPMIDAHVDQIRQLRPQTIRLFVQEFFSLYPKHGEYHWETFDKSIEAILATGAKPLLSLCFKPRVLYPKIDQEIVHPTHYQEWEELIVALVKHCNAERKFGIEYWEIGNEPDIGEDGGCPYRFQPEDYVTYYTHTARAILRADAKAKVGGPALAGYRSRIGDALIEHCGKGLAPLHFFSWHIYDSEPRRFRESIREVKTKLARHARLATTETILDEWNMSLDQPVLAPSFQPAFVLDTTYGFLEEGLSRSAYYHIRDYFVDPLNFSSWMSEKGVEFMAHWWNVMPQYDGLFDNQGRVRPAYYAFQWLGLMKGERVAVKGLTENVKAIAVQEGIRRRLLFWNFPASGPGEPVQVKVQWAPNEQGQFRLIRLNATSAVNTLELRRTGRLSDLKTKPLQTTLDPHEVLLLEVAP